MNKSKFSIKYSNYGFWNISDEEGNYLCKDFSIESRATENALYLYSDAVNTLNNWRDQDG